MWRPKDWENPHRKVGSGFGDDVTWDMCEGREHKAYEAGADAILKALRKEKAEIPLSELPKFIHRKPAVRK